MDVEKLIDDLDELVVIARNSEDIGVSKWLSLNGSVADVKELLEKQLNDRWISVSERLPNREEFLKNDGRFIVTDGNRVYESSFDLLIENDFCYIEYSRSGVEIKTDKVVVAWKPLPEPYRGE